MSARSIPLSDTAELPIDTAEVDAKPVERDPHADVREAIAARMEARRMAEVEASQPDFAPRVEADEPDEPEAEAVAAPAPDPEPVRQAPPVVAAPVVPPAPQLYPVQTHQGVVYVTADQMAQLASMGAMAATQARQAPPPAVETPAAPVAPTQEDAKARAREVARRIAYGNEDEAATALMEYHQAMAPQVDADTIRRQAANDAVQHITLQNNLHTIGNEFPQVFGSTVLTQVAALQLNEIRRDPRASQFSDLDLYREACRRVVGAFGASAQQPQPERDAVPSTASQAAPVVSPTRLERKRAAPSMPTATDRRLGSGDDATRPETNAEIIARMAKARGPSRVK